MTANIAAETLFGHTLAHMARERSAVALPPGGALIQLIERCFAEEAPVRAHDLDIAGARTMPQSWRTSPLDRWRVGWRW